MKPIKQRNKPEPNSDIHKDDRLLDQPNFEEEPDFTFRPILEYIEEWGQKKKKKFILVKVKLLYLAERVCRQRGNNHNISPPAKLNMKNTVSNFVPTSPLILIGVKYGILRKRCSIDEV